MTDTSTSGWYPDPEGRPGFERWWNGLGWGESVRPVSGSGTTLTAPGPAPSAYGIQYEVSSGAEVGYPPTSPAQGHAPPAQPDTAGAAGRAKVRVSPAAWAWFAGSVVLALIIALVVFAGGGDPQGPGVPIATGGVPSGGQTPPPGTTRIVDEAAGVAYPYLGTYWMEFVNEVAETTSTAGQYIVTQEQTPDGGQFIAQVTSGPLRPDFGYAGPSSFPGTIVAVQDSVRNRYYPLPNTIETLRDEAVTIDGAAAHLLEFNLNWDVSGYDSTGERAALILIETGRAAPALMYISIPNTHAELYGVVDRVIAAIDVLN